MTKSDIGVIILMWLTANGMAWLTGFGYGLSVKDMIIIPNVMILFIVIFRIAMWLMGIN